MTPTLVSSATLTTTPRPEMALPRDVFSMALLRTTKTSRVGALMAALILVTATVWLWDRATLPLLITPSFLPAYGAFVFTCEGLTALLLSIQFYNSRDLSVGAVGMAYGFSAPVIALQVLTFPDVFVKGVLLGGTQSAVWFWVIAHSGFPTLLLIAMLTRIYRPFIRLPARGFVLVWWAVTLVTLLLVIAAGIYVIADASDLPELIAARSYNLLVHSAAGCYAIVINVLAFIAIAWVGRGKSPLFLWLGVAALASLCDVSITMAGGSRYSEGWYGARAMSVVTAIVVLGFSLFEVTRLYASLSSANRRLLNMATIDSLTALPNRRAMDLTLAREIRRAERSREPLSVLMLDIDYFKYINDSLGHLYGDECLTEVAHVLAAHSRRVSDLVARFGGEEFVVVLADTTHAGALRQAEEVRAAVEALGLNGGGRPDGGKRLTASFGVCTWDPASMPMPRADEVLAGADAALYRAKKGGRNRVCSGDIVARKPAEGNVVSHAVGA